MPISGLDTIKTGDNSAITIYREPNGKMKVTSSRWDEVAHIYPGQY